MRLIVQHTTMWYMTITRAHALACLLFGSVMVLYHYLCDCLNHWSSSFSRYWCWLVVNYTSQPSQLVILTMDIHGWATGACQFVARNATNKWTKFYHVVAALVPESSLTATTCRYPLWSCRPGWSDEQLPQSNVASDNYSSRELGNCTPTTAAMYISDSCNLGSLSRLQFQFWIPWRDHPLPYRPWLRSGECHFWMSCKPTKTSWPLKERDQ